MKIVTNIRDVLACACLVIFLNFPVLSPATRWPEWIQSQRVLISAALIASALALLLRTRSRLDITYALGWVALSGALIVSFWTARWAPYATYCGLVILLGSLVAWLALSARAMEIGLIVATGLHGGLGLVVMVSQGGSISEYGLDRSGALLGSVIDSYRTLGICTAFSIATVLRSRGLFGGSMAASGLLGLVLTWSRAGVLGVLAGVGVALIRLRLKRALTIGVLVCILLSTMLTFQARRSSRDLASASKRSDMSRPLAWRQAITRFQEAPLLGHGMMSVDFPIRAVKADGSSRRAVLFEPKNQILYLLSQLGVVGAVLFECVFGGGLLLTVRSRHPMAVGLLAAWVSSLVIGVFDTPFFTLGSGPPDFLLGTLIVMTARVGMGTNQNKPEDECEPLG